MHRFFVPLSALEGNRFAIEDDPSHQIARVLRLRPGDHIIVLDNSGWEIEVELTEVTGSRTAGLVQQRSLVSSEPLVQITIYQGVLKGDHFELVIQKGTELGVAGFVPVITQRCVVADVDLAGTKYARWQRIIQEAAEQSGRGRLPKLYPAAVFESACRQASGLNLLPWEGERRRGLRGTLRRHLRGPRRPFAINLFIGPEGGFAPEEVALAQALGFEVVSFGPRILRAETAAIAAATAILYEAGALDPSGG